MTPMSEVDLLAEVRALWRDDLRPVRADSLHPALSGFVRDFLVTVGLPAKTSWQMEFFHGGPVREPLHVSGRDLVIFGEEHATPLVVDVAAGSVWSVVPGVRRPLRFLNSSLPLLLVTLGRMSRVLVEFRDAPPPQALRLTRRTRHELAALDPPSMAPDAQWSDYLDQLEEGE